MILYHGTPERWAKEILNVGYISNDRKSNYKDFSNCHDVNGKRVYKETEKGYIYLSNQFQVALRYGKIARGMVDEYSNWYYVFRLEIDEKELQPDYDELLMKCGIDDKIVSAEESLEKCGSVRIKHPIVLKDCNATYVKIPVDIDDERVRYTVFDLLGFGYVDRNKERYKYSQLKEYIKIFDKDFEWENLKID